MATWNEALNKIAAQSITVGQLIADLQRFPPDTVVVMHAGEDYGFCEILHACRDKCGDVDVARLSPFEHDRDKP